MKQWFRQWNYPLISILLGDFVVIYLMVLGIIYIIKHI